MTEIDYAAAFDELTLLNELFAQHKDFLLPRLNSNHYKVVQKGGTGDVIIQGIRSGFYYLSSRSYVGASGFGTLSYTAFRRVEPVERIVIDWVRPSAVTE